MVSDLDTGDILSNGFDDSRSFMPEDNWKCSFWILARKGICV